MDCTTTQATGISMSAPLTTNSSASAPRARRRALARGDAGRRPTATGTTAAVMAHRLARLGRDGGGYRRAGAAQTRS